MKFDASNEEWQILSLNGSFKIFEFSCGVGVDEDLILITGGKKKASDSPNMEAQRKEEEDDEKSDAVADCYIYSIKLNTFFKFAQLNFPRYYHMMVAYKNFAYVLGGGSIRGSNTEFMGTSSVEKISLVEVKEKVNEYIGTKKSGSLDFKLQWSEVEPFTKIRYKGNAFVYKDNIFLIGGLSKENKTCRYIEKYNSYNNQWSFLKWKLPFALHSSSLTALNHNELLMIGGRNDAGLVSSIYQLDLLKGRYKSRRGFSLREYPKILHFEDNIYIFGGDEQKSCERFNPIEFVSLSSNESYTSLLDSDLIKFPSSAPSVTIGTGSAEDPDFEENFVGNEPEGGTEKFYLLGTPSLPFLLEFDGAYESVTYLNVSLYFRFYYFGVSKKINNNYVISLGGVTPPFKKASKSVQILNLKALSSKKCTKMLEGRIKFDAVVFENKVFVCGGQNYINQKEKYLKTAELYDVDTDIWKPLPTMSTARYNHCLYLYKRSIFAVGGSDGENVLNTIEEFNLTSNNWTLIEMVTHEPIILFTITNTKKEEEILVIGGNNGKMNLSMVVVYNFEKMTSSVIGGIKQPRCQHKMIGYQDDIIIFGGVGGENLGFEVIKANNFNYKTEAYANLEKSVKKFYSDKSLLGIPVC